MADDKKTLKFQMMMSPVEAEALDDFMFKHRLRSRAEAIRRLTHIALEAEPALTGIAADSIALAQVYDDILDEMGVVMSDADGEEAWRMASLKMFGDLILIHNKLKELALVTVAHRNFAMALTKPIPIADAIEEAAENRRRDRESLIEMQEEFERQNRVVLGKAKPKRSP